MILRILWIYQTKTNLRRSRAVRQRVNKYGRLHHASPVTVSLERVDLREEPFEALHFICRLEEKTLYMTYSIFKEKTMKFAINTYLSFSSGASTCMLKSLVGLMRNNAARYFIRNAHLSVVH